MFIYDKKDHFKENKLDTLQAKVT